MKFIATFKKDPFYMLKYLGGTFLMLLCLNGILFATKTTLPHYQLFLLSLLLMAPNLTLILVASLAIIVMGVSGSYFVFDPTILYFLPLGACMTFILGGMLHNAAHYNFRPKWLNPIIGELVSFHHLFGAGYQIYSIQHSIHHKYPDDPDKDPHPPLNLSYWGFAKMMKTTIQRVLSNHYFENHKEVENSRRLWNTSTVFVPLNRYLRATTLLLLFGPELFCLFFIPSYICVVFMTAHFNYVTHQKDENGVFQIINQKDGLFYGFINLISWNMYYHKNHHEKCTVFNPKYIHGKNTESSQLDKSPLITVNASSSK